MLPDTILEPSHRPRRFVVDLLTADGVLVPRWRRICMCRSYAEMACQYDFLMAVVKPNNLMRVAKLPFPSAVEGLRLNDPRDWVLEGWAELPVLFVVHGPHLVVLGGAP